MPRRPVFGSRAAYLRVAVAAILAAAVVSFAGAADPASVAASGGAGAQATELVRLMNGERAFRGLAPLRVDPFLASKAQDGSIACPNNAASVMQGRAKDFALNGGWPANAHALRLCPTYSVLYVMQHAWRYTSGAVGEVVALNGLYGTGRSTYSFGCTNNETSGCPGSSTYTYYTTARASAVLMASSGHRATVLGAFDRVGCGAWISSSGTFYYSCLFSTGGPYATSAPPVTSPFGNPAPPPRATRTPPPAATTKPTARPPATTSAPGVPTGSPAATIAASSSTAPDDRASGPVPPADSPMATRPVETGTAGPLDGSGDAPGAVSTPAASDQARANAIRDESSWPPGEVAFTVAALALIAGAGAGLVAIAMARRRAEKNL